MSGILDLLNSDLGKSLVGGVAAETDQPQNKTHEVLTMALPVLMTAMKRNASSSEGAQNLFNAIQNDHDGSILNNLGSLFEGGVEDSVKTDGKNILDHILGNKQSNVEKAISIKSGISTDSVAQILKVAAPILLGMLSNQAKQKNVERPGGLESLLSDLLKGDSPQNEPGFLESILDADGDGNVIDDVAGMVLGGNKKKDGLGNLMNGMFGDQK